MSGWWFSASASSATRFTNAIASERRQLEGPLERPVDLTPLVHRGQYRARRGKDPAPEDTNTDDERRRDRLVDGAARRGCERPRRPGPPTRAAAEGRAVRGRPPPPDAAPAERPGARRP